ncbi:MAG: SLOG family protein [Acidimicrobiales bacterium]
MPGPSTVTEVYTDGACLGNPGPGGWAWAVPGGRFASGAEAHTTNQRMEIKAALEAVRAFDGPLVVVSDSTYVVNCFRDRWWEGWLKRGWVNTAKKPVANRDLWEPLIAAVRADPTRVAFRWVKGHSDDPANDLVDRLAVEAARTQTGRTGDGTPSDLGPPDAPGDPRLPPGRLVAVTGHRPPELGGYDANPTADRVRARLAEVLAAKRQLHPDLVLLTGLGLGTEQLAAEAAAEAGVPYVAVLPYPDPDSQWPESSRRHYRELLDGAQSTVTLQAKAPATRQLAGAALRRRDAWLARNAHEALAVWDGEDPAVGRSVRALQDALGEEEVWVLAPEGS